MIGKKIKVALCLSGEPRSSMFCFPYIYESFINLGEQYEVDVYIHSEKNFRALSIYNPVNYNWSTPDPIEDSTFINNLKSNVKSSPKLKEAIYFYENYTSQTNFILNQIRMLRGINISFNLIPSSNKPDIVIRCRLDLYTDFKLEVKNIINDILKNRYDIFIPSKTSNTLDPIISKESDVEYSDQLAIGNYDSMLCYSDMINNLDFLLEDTQEWKGEYWLKSQLLNSNIKVNSYYLPFFLVRETKVKLNRGLYAKDLTFLDQ